MAFRCPSCVDGGMTDNDWLMQFFADVVGLPVERPIVRETTAFGVAMLALMQCDGAFTLDDISNRWQRDAEFVPDMDSSSREELINNWDLAMRRTLVEC